MSSATEIEKKLSSYEAALPDNIFSKMENIAFGILITAVAILALGLVFANDIFWMLKTTISNIIPIFIHDYFYDSLLVTLPKPGKTYVMPIVAPLAGIFLTYGSNVIFQFLHEQKDKKFLLELAIFLTMYRV